MTSVSIVVPIYNVEKYLSECLKSIQKQTLKDIEVICVDDGSTDNSLKIVQNFIKNDNRFKCITKPNAGYGDSMNRGFDMASGDYIGIVESDDYIESDMFEILYNVACRNDCCIVKSDYYEFTTKTKRRPVYVNTVFNVTDYNKIVNYSTCKDLFHYKMNTWTGIYKNSFIKNHNIRHNLTPGAAYQDNGFWFQTLSLADRIIFVNKAFYHYRQDNPNSSINSKKKVFCMCEEYEYIEEFLRNHPKIQDDLYTIFLVKKYYNYMYTYKRINDEFKIGFLERFAFEFLEPVKSGTLSENTVDPHIFQIITRIIDNPKKFYYTDTIWVLQHKLVEENIKNQKLENTFVYRLLKKLRLV